MDRGPLAGCVGGGKQTSRLERVTQGWAGATPLAARGTLEDATKYRGEHLRIGENVRQAFTRHRYARCSERSLLRERTDKSAAASVPPDVRDRCRRARQRTGGGPRRAAAPTP